MYTDFEQDLILACKGHYDEKGIDKVIRDYIGYSEDQEILLDSKYHFISDLYLKMIENKHLNLSHLIEELSPRHIYDFNIKSTFNNTSYKLYDTSKIICNYMISEICNVRVQDDKEIIFKLHEAKEKFKDKIN